MEPGLCRFKCEVCLCSCQARFNEDKRHTIVHSLFKSSKQEEKVSSKSCESKNTEGWLLFIDYVKSSLHNNSVWEFQGFDSCPENETGHHNKWEDSSRYKSDTGLAGYHSQLSYDCICDSGGWWDKEGESIQQQAREELAGQKGRGGGQRKNPLEQLTVSLDDHTPLASKFVTNMSNRAWRNGLSSVTMDPHQETAAAVAVAVEATAAIEAALAATAAPTAAANKMMERIKKRVLHMYLNTLNTVWTKKVAAKVQYHIRITGYSVFSVDHLCLPRLATCYGLASGCQQPSTSKGFAQSLHNYIVIFRSHIFKYLY